MIDTHLLDGATGTVSSSGTAMVSMIIWPIVCRLKQIFNWISIRKAANNKWLNVECSTLWILDAMWKVKFVFRKWVIFFSCFIWTSLHMKMLTFGKMVHGCCTFLLLIVLLLLCHSCLFFYFLPFSLVHEISLVLV